MDSPRTQLKFFALAALLHFLLAIVLFGRDAPTRVPTERPAVTVRLIQPRLQTTLPLAKNPRSAAPPKQGAERKRVAKQELPTTRPAGHHAAPNEPARSSATADALSPSKAALPTGPTASAARHLSVSWLATRTAQEQGPSSSQAEGDAGRRMLDDFESEVRQQNATRAGLRGVLTEVARSLRQAYAPRNDVVREVMAGARKPTLGRPAPRPITEDRIHASLHPNVAEHTAAIGSLELTAVQFQLLAIVRLFHQPPPEIVAASEGDAPLEPDVEDSRQAGTNSRAAIMRSSGSDTFDQAALDAAQSTVGLRLWFPPNEPQPVWSDWKFSQTVYRGGGGFGSLGALNRPPGTFDPDLKVSVDAEVSFITAAYTDSFPGQARPARREEPNPQDGRQNTIK